MGTQPENTHGIQTQTQPNPYPKFGLGPGITLGYPNFGYPIPTLLGIKYRQTRRSLLTKLIILYVKRELMHASGYNFAYLIKPVFNLSKLAGNTWKAL